MPCAPQLDAGALVGTEAESDVRNRHEPFHCSSSRARAECRSNRATKVTEQRGPSKPSASALPRAIAHAMAPPSTQGLPATQGLSRLPLSARRAKPERALWGRPQARRRSRAPASGGPEQRAHPPSRPQAPCPRAIAHAMAPPSTQGLPAAQGLSRLPLSARRAKPEHALWGRPQARRRSRAPASGGPEQRAHPPSRPQAPCPRAIASNRAPQWPPSTQGRPVARELSRLPLFSPLWAKILGETAGAQAKPSTCEWGHPCLTAPRSPPPTSPRPSRAPHKDTHWPSRSSHTPPRAWTHWVRERRFPGR